MIMRCNLRQRRAIQLKKEEEEAMGGGDGGGGGGCQEG